MGKADLHLHTTHSDGQASVSALLDAVAVRGDLDVIAITDHDTIAGAERDQHLARARGYRFAVVVGEEVSTRDGHVIGLFLSAPVPPGRSAAATVAAIHAQGGLAYAPHPFFRDRPLRRRRAMEGVGRGLLGLAVDAVEVINGTPALAWANLRAGRFARRHRLPALGASDAHILAAIGKGHTFFPGHSVADLRRAILAGTVRAGAERYTPRDLLAYLRFWCAYGRQQRQAPGWLA